MKHDITSICRQYAGKFHKYMESARGQVHPPPPLAGFGREVLMLAQVHEQAAIDRSATRSGRSLPKVADAYFAQVIGNLVDERGVSAHASARLETARDKLQERTRSLVAAHAELHRVEGQRTRAEVDLATCRKHYAKLKIESNRLQRGLRSLTRQAINAQEAQSGRISRELRDNIAQTLIGINVRLLALKLSSEKETSDITEGIASVQQVAKKTIASMRSSAKKDEIP